MKIIQVYEGGITLYWSCSMVKYSKKYNHLKYIFQIISEMQAKIDNQEGEMRKLRDLLKERDTQIEVLKSTLTLERSRLPHRHKKTDRHI